MNKKIKSIAAVILLCGVVMTSCYPRVEVNPNEMTLSVGGMVFLQGTVNDGKTYTIGAEMDSWESSDLEIATVSGAGLVHAISPGKCSITGTYGGKSDFCDLTVTDELNVDHPDNIVIKVGETKQVLFTVYGGIHPEYHVDDLSIASMGTTITVDGVTITIDNEYYSISTATTYTLTRSITGIMVGETALKVIHRETGKDIAVIPVTVLSE